MTNFPPSFVFTTERPHYSLALFKKTPGTEKHKDRQKT